MLSSLFAWRSTWSSARPLMVLLALLLALAALGLHAQPVQPVPALASRIIDQTGTLDAATAAALEEKLAAFERSKGSQLVFLLVSTTQPEDIASYANRVGNTWKIGRAGVGDSVLLVVAKEDRKVRIEVAKTLEGAIPDLAAKQIIDEAITPNFRAGNYGAGLSAAADQMMARIKGEALPAVANPGAKGWGGNNFDWMELAMIAFIAVPIAASVLRSVFGRKLGVLLTGGGFGALAWLITSSMVIAGIAGVLARVVSLLSNLNMGRSGRHQSGGSWGSGGGGGWGSDAGAGGFSSGGGGDFGGGGASGDW